MAIDPSIALGFRGIEAPNPLAAYGQVAQIQNAQNQNALAQYQLGAAKRTDEQQNVLNELTAQNYDPNTGQINMRGLTSGLAARGHGSLIPAQLAKEQEMQTKAAQLQKTQAEILDKEIQHVNSVITNLRFNPTNENVVAHNQDIQKGRFSPETKAFVAKQEEILLGMKPDERVKFLEQAGAKAGDVMRAQSAAAALEETKRANKEREKSARDRLAQDAQSVTYQTDANGNIVAVPSKIAPGMVPKATAIIAPGTGMEPLKAKDASKTAVSEQQASYNIGRVLNAAKEVNKVASKNPSAIQPGLGEAAASSIGMSGTANAARNADRQIVYGAQRDALDALLYLATGAAYNKEQLEGQMAAYIPAYTDKAPAVAAKKERMSNLIQSAKTRAGKAWTPEMENAMQSLVNPTSATPAAGGGEWSVVK